MRPIQLTKQFKLRFENVKEWQALHGMGDGRLFGYDVLHISEAPPGVDRPMTAASVSR